jgi:hypothetical protein
MVFFFVLLGAHLVFVFTTKHHELHTRYHADECLIFDRLVVELDILS